MLSPGSLAAPNSPSMRPPVVRYWPRSLGEEVLLLRSLHNQVGGVCRAIQVEVHAPRLEAQQLVDLVRERGAVQVLRQQQAPCPQYTRRWARTI